MVSCDCQDIPRKRNPQRIWPLRSLPQEREQAGWVSIQYLQGNTSIPFKLEDCPNGTAYDKAKDRFFVTGTCWRRYFRLRLYPKDDGEILIFFYMVMEGTILDMSLLFHSGIR